MTGRLPSPPASRPGSAPTAARNTRCSGDRVCTTTRAPARRPPTRRAALVSSEQALAQAKAGCDRDTPIEGEGGRVGFLKKHRQVPIEDAALALLFRQKQEELDREVTLISDRNTPRFLPGSLAL